MKINIKEIKNSQIISADTIDKIVYKENSNLSQKEFEEIKSALKKIPDSVLQAFKNEYETELKESNPADDKNSLGKKIKDFFIKQGIPLLEHISETAIVEYSKHLFANLH